MQKKEATGLEIVGFIFMCVCVCVYNIYIA